MTRHTLNWTVKGATSRVDLERMMKFRAHRETKRANSFVRFLFFLTFMACGGVILFVASPTLRMAMGMLSGSGGGASGSGASGSQSPGAGGQSGGLGKLDAALPPGASGTFSKIDNAMPGGPAATFGTLSNALSMGDNSGTSAPGTLNNPNFPGGSPGSANLGPLATMAKPIFDQLRQTMGTNSFVLGLEKFLNASKSTGNGPSQAGFKSLRVLPEDWQKQNFGRTGIDPNGDEDLDGVSNYDEYLQGTNPLDYFSQWGGTVVPQIASSSGNNQSAVAGSFAPDAISLVVTDAQGRLLSNAPVRFQVMNGEGKLQPNSSENPKTNLIVGTDSKGQARVYFKAPDSTDDVTQIEATTGYGDLQKKNSFTMKTVAATPGVTAANPFALSNMQAMLNPDGSVTLTWDNNPDNLDPIPIKVEQPDGTWSVVATVPPGSTSFLIPPQ